MKKYLIFILTFLSIYLVTWIINGEKLLFEQGTKCIKEYGVQNYHNGKEFMIISKIKGKIVNHEYKTKLPNKIIITISNKEEEDAFFNKLPDNRNDNNILVFGVEINIVKNNFIYGILDYRVIPNDITSNDSYFIWAIVDWIHISR